MNRRNFITTTVSAGVLGSVGISCSKNQRDKSKTLKQPNIIWIMMDDCRADALGSYGKPWCKTPVMDSIVRQGVRFKTAIVQNPVCVPSRRSMLTGLYPHTILPMAMGKPPGVPPTYLDEKDLGDPNLLNSWKKAGINPVNVGKIHAFREDWVSKGDRRPKFDVFGKASDKDVQSKMEQSGSTYPDVVTKTHKWAIGGIIPLEPEETSIWEMGNLAVDTMKELVEADSPFFLRVSFHAPHVPCRVPSSHMIDPEEITLPLPTEKELQRKPRFERDALRMYSGGLDLTEEQIKIGRGTYYGMVSLVDVQVGRILDCLRKAGLTDNTILAINSDQGFLLGEHGMWKKRCFYDANVCSPLILSCPSLLPGGKVIDEPVEMVDFIPTLLELSGLEVPGSISGRSLMSLIRGDVREWREACFSEIDHSQSMYKELRNGTGRRVMVRTREWKLEYFMDSRVPEKDGSLYNLKKDPDELENLYDNPAYRDIIKYLEQLTETWDQTG